MAVPPFDCRHQMCHQLSAPTAGQALTQVEGRGGATGSPACSRRSVQLPRGRPRQRERVSSGQHLLGTSVAPWRTMAPSALATPTLREAITGAFFSLFNSFSTINPSGCPSTPLDDLSCLWLLSSPAPGTALSRLKMSVCLDQNAKRACSCSREFR